MFRARAKTWMGRPRNSNVNTAPGWAEMWMIRTAPTITTPPRPPSYGRMQVNITQYQTCFRVSNPRARVKIRIPRTRDSSPESEYNKSARYRLFSRLLFKFDYILFWSNFLSVVLFWPWNLSGQKIPLDTLGQKIRSVIDFEYSLTSLSND